MCKKKKLFLFVIEGAEREKDYFSNFSSVFFNGKNEVITIYVPAEMNVYMLYDILKKDNFETDIVEVIKENIPKAEEILHNYARDSFAEIYLFFDFDEHANNLKEKENVDALREMLMLFDNETELGKLYISYPMVEALRDHVGDSCGIVSGGCSRNRNSFGDYKEDSSKNPSNNNVGKYDYPKWMSIIRNYVYRMSCLFSKKRLEHDDFLSTNNPLSIFNKQMAAYKLSDNIFVLSCFPEFLIDYSEKYWDESVGKRKRPVLRKGCSNKL